MRKIYILASVLGFQLAAVAALETTGAEVCASADGVGEYYKWTSGGTLTVPAGGKKFDLLLVGGGGAGGFCRGGGGGGGGVIYREGYTLPEGTYTIVIGAGGVPDAWTKDNHPTSSGSCYQQAKSTSATCGGNTVLSLGETPVFCAVGGGGGGTFVLGNTTDSAGLPGGCGGGSAGKSTLSASGTADQGFAGGIAKSDNDMVSGGGGGAGGPGAPAQNGTVSGNGGVGFECLITGEKIRYAGGGGAGAYENRTSGLGGGGLKDAGGAGNGGTGGSGKNANDGMTAGVDGLGGGGGGSSGSANNWAYCIGAKGGSGVFILREVAATKPTLDHVSATLDGRTLTLSATLVTLGTSPDGTQEATSAIVSVAYGTDPEQLVFKPVKDDWTLTEAQWEYPISDLTAYTTYYWAIRVENNLGHAIRQDYTGSLFVEGRGQPLPGVVGFSDASIIYTYGGIVFGGDPFYAIDGRDDSRVDINVNDLRLAYDLGEAKHVGAFRMIFPKNGVGDNYIVDRMGELAVYGSNDKANWTLLTSQAQVGHELYGHAGEWLTYPVLVNGKFRYYEVRGLKYGNVLEMEFVAEEMGLKVDPPSVFGATDPNAADDPAGVTVSGVLTYSPSEETTIYGYWADEDFDADEAAWAAKGTRFAVTGAYKTGDAFSTKVPVAAKGRHYLRLFAQDGEEKTSSHRSWGFNIASKVAAVPCYVSHSTGKESLQNWYDGNVNNYCDTGTACSIIFDLSKIPSSDYLAGIRIWPRSGSGNYVEWVRHRTMKVSVSYDEGAITGSGETLVAGREVYQVADSSAVTNWQQLDEFINDAVVPVAKVEDLMVTLPKKQRRPHYLKIENVALNNMNELELRTVKGASGLIVIFQ